MAIRVNLDQLLLDRRITLTDLADRIGITIANLSVLKTNKARAIRFSTLDALCRELDCQPGDLLESSDEASGKARPQTAASAAQSGRKR
ncbi:MAG TPA: helix-turn-helix transcriptional regulator [Vicinamibacterales bacterium]|nr:helix-turn-helix transcriptional regulator [Vicinamibacterales bacterium]